VHGGYQAGAGTRLEANAHLANMDLFDPGTVTQPFQDHWYDIRRWGADLSLSHASRHGDTQFRLHGNFGRHRIYDGFRSNDHTHGVMFYHTATPWHHASLTAGFDWKSYGGTARNVFTHLDYSDHAIVEYAPYLHLQQLLLKRVILSGGLRREHHEVFGAMVLPKAGVVYHVTPSTSVRLSMAKGFRSPTIRELYLFPAPTPDLKPEEVWSREVGLTQLVGEGLRFEAALFAAEGKNLIRLKWPRYINSGTFYHTGYEASLNWLPGADFAVTATWSKHDLDDQTLYAPGKKATLIVTVPWRTWRCALQAQHIRDLFAADFRRQPLPDYTTVNASLTWQILPVLQARGVVNNLFAAEYQSLQGYPMPGRTGRLEMNLIW
jgi:iron complex outermembrane receptor protein